MDSLLSLFQTIKKRSLLTRLVNRLEILLSVSVTLLSGTVTLLSDSVGLLLISKHTRNQPFRPLHILPVLFAETFRH
jgi:hypothetical protein